VELDLAAVPFTRFGAYVAFSLLPAAADRPAGLYLRSLRGPATGGRPMQEILHLELRQRGQSVPTQATATPTLLRLDCAGGTAEICLAHPATIRVRLRGAALRLHMPAGAYDNVIPGPAGRWQLTVNTVCETKLMLTPLAGSIAVDAPWQDEHSAFITLILEPDPATGWGEFALDEYTVDWPGPDHEEPFAACVARVAGELRQFVAGLPAVPPAYSPARELAGYVLWSCTVAPAGHLARPAVFASKNGMIGIWSWDHCFHTLALADGHPDLAWDQFMVLFDQQAPSGALPDLINDRLLSWSFCKPPVHGWLLSRLLRDSDLLTPARLAAIYDPLARWTEWWFAHRDDDGDGIPQCNHGNDSGWDNSTVFAARPPVETPEVAAYLVLQMEFLAEAARRLSWPDAAAEWTRRAATLLQRLLAHFWRDDRFVAVQVAGHQDIAAASLLLFMPLVLGKRLPAAVRTALIARLQAPGQYLTEFGLATENLTSPDYRPKGYWRGPIWPAPTLIAIDSLEACGERALAAELRRRFCDLVARSGMAENFDARTGQGYHDFHFSWTASIFLTLAHELLEAPAPALESKVIT
jgi:hypothetical protein